VQLGQNQGMSAYDPLALTQPQLDIIRAAAGAVKPEWRERFLGQVSDALIGRNEISDSDLAAFVSKVLSTISPGDMEADNCC
jgi:hypothetical protein